MWYPTNGCSSSKKNSKLKLNDDDVDNLFFIL